MMEQYEVIKRRLKFRRDLIHKKHETPQLEKKCREEGLNFLYKLSALAFLVSFNKHPSLRMRNTLSTILELLEVYEYMLRGLSRNPLCLNYERLLGLGYMKRKHWVYAAYIGLISSLPVLYKVSPYNDIIRAAIAKTSFGTSVKLLDNLNDNVHELDVALTSLRNLLSAYTRGVYEPNVDRENEVARAENSALEIGTWIYAMINANGSKPNDTFEIYVKDVRKLIMGQIDSLSHKDKKRSEIPTMKDYMEYILEKNIGDVWFDIDLCFFEKGLGGLTSGEMTALTLVKQGVSLVFKAAGLYDDVVDAYDDITSNSINSAILLAIERGLLSYDDLRVIEPARTFKILSKAGIFNDIIRMGDAMHVAGLNMIKEGLKYPVGQLIDGDALLNICDFIRLFSIRKYLIREKKFRQSLAFIRSPNPSTTLPKDLSLLWNTIREKSMQVCH
jgi:hypothetical protein